MCLLKILQKVFLIHPIVFALYFDFKKVNLLQKRLVNMIMLCCLDLFIFCLFMRGLECTLDWLVFDVSFIVLNI